MTHKNRIKKVQKLLQDENLVGLIVDNTIDIYYLTGLELSLGRLLIMKESATLFVDGRYLEMCEKASLVPVVLTKGYDKKSAFADICTFKKDKIGFDAEATFYQNYQELKSLFPNLVPLSNPIKHIRQIKDAQEIEHLKKAASLAYLGYEKLLSLLEEGVEEKTMAVELEIFWLKSGGEKLAFTPHIAFGANSSLPHYHCSQRKLKSGDAVLMDIGVVLNNYYSDMTRVKFFGTPPKELEKIYNIVSDAQQAAFEKCRPGEKVGDVDMAARDVISQSGYGEFFPHSLGHGVGLEIHEFPIIRSRGKDSDLKLSPGMVFTIEPGIYLPNVGGVRLEDTIVITDDGYENLTNSNKE